MAALPRRSTPGRSRRCATSSARIGRPIAMRFGLVANRLHRREADGGLGPWARECDGGIRALDFGLHAVGGTHDALQRQGLLQDHGPLVRLPYGSEGGVMR